MWQKNLQRTSYWALTTPIYLAIVIVRLVNYKSILKDLGLCVGAVKNLEGRFLPDITPVLIRTLIVAEDHRHALHFGVDPIAIVRALKVRLLDGKRQGASTIEQQLVRTLTQRYEKTPRRKIREQILAVMLSSQFAKDEVCSAYLKVAFYGSGRVGGLGIQRIRNVSAECSDAIIVAYLKYPKSVANSGQRAIKHLNRVEHIKHLLNGDINLFLLKQTAGSKTPADPCPPQH